MYKAFSIAGYSAEEVDANFPGMVGAFKIWRAAARWLGAGDQIAS